MHPNVSKESGKKRSTVTFASILSETRYLLQTMKEIPRALFPYKQESPTLWTIFRRTGDKKMKPSSLVRHGLVVSLMFTCAMAYTSDYYTAAVFEHNRQGDNITDDPIAVIKINLENYERACKAAAEQGADIILFPEYGIFPATNRSQTKGFLEMIPNPKEIAINPCHEEVFADRPIQYALSCMARENEIVVVANMGSIQHCEGESDCPDDGDFHFNANVAFDKNGTLIARYYKERLFYEFGMDLPREEQDPSFDTGFGKFATFVCFDIIFEKISSFSQREDIDAIFFSKMWNNQSPFYVATQWLQAWAIGNNATILSADIQSPGHLSTGSGIYMGRKGSIGHTLNPDGISKLVVATIPRNNRVVSTGFNITAVFKNGTREWDDDGRNIPDVCSYYVLGPAKDIDKDYRCLDEKVENYTLAKLLRAEDHLEVCHNSMCCELDYVANSMNESYYLGVYNGTNSPFTRYFWWEENCFLARCDDVNGTACSTFPMASETLFQKIYMRGNFTSKRVYPSLVAERLKLIPTEDWTFDSRPELSSINMESTNGISLLAATLKGRAYDKDPPYVR